MAYRRRRFRKSRIAIAALSPSVGLDALSEIVQLSSERRLSAKRLTLGADRATNSEAQMSGLVVCRAACPEGRCDARPGVALAPTRRGALACQLRILRA